mgnify:CR=1 FL=1
MKNNNKEIMISSLGGLGVVGMNCYVIEYLNSIYIMDAGILFANDDIPGVDYIIPDFTYLKENEDKIKALLITHGHEDHIGAIPMLLEKVKIPVIYSNGLGYSLIRDKMFEYPDIKYNLKQFNENDELTFEGITVTFFRTNHSIPDSFGIAFRTPLGYIVNTGDFRFDYTPVGKKSDFYKMAKLGHDGVLCLMADSTNADIYKLSLSEKQVALNIKQMFKRIEGRVIVATFASNVFRVKNILEASQNVGRKVAIFGHSMEKTIESALRLKYINIDKDLIISQKEINNYDPSKITILCTGSQGEPMAALSRIAKGTHKQIKLLPNDTIIYSSKPIPGNEQFINRNVNMLIASGAKVIINNPMTDTHTTGHATREEMKLMLNLMNPKYFVPVHGEYRMLKEHAGLAVECGVPKENCFCLNSGDVLHINSRNAKVVKGEITADDVYLDSNMSDIYSNVSKEKKHLSEEGFISITITINKKKEIVLPVRLDFKGFVDVSKTENISNSIKQKTQSICTKFLSQTKAINIKNLRSEITSEVSQYIYELIERKPFISTIITIL